MIRQLLVSDENEMQVYQHACVRRASVTVSGIDAHDSVFRVYRGIVRNIEDFPAAETPNVPRWRITVQC